MSRSRRLRRRFWWESGLAAVTFLLLVLTAAVPNWIEVVFGVDPDGGDGTLEIAMALAAVIGLGCAWLARLEWRRGAAPRAA
jgi:hypothetical protein